MLAIVKGPYLQWPTQSTMTIMWETSEPATSRVEVFRAERIHSGHQGNYKEPQQLLTSASSDNEMAVHQLTVSNLEPGTAYFYKVYSSSKHGQTTSEMYPFKTAGGKLESFSFTVTSETGGYSWFDTTEGEINRRVFRQMQRYRPDFVLFVGDIVDDGARYEDWDRYFFRPGKELLATTPCYSCLGNHENNGSWYYDFFAFHPPKNYYSFNYGDAHFVCLDSTAFIPPDTYPHSPCSIGPGNAQYDFLVRDLQHASSAKWKIVFFIIRPMSPGVIR